MSSKEYFEQIIATAQAGLAALSGGETSPPVTEPPSTPRAITEQVLASEGQYLCGPKLILCANGDILSLYRNGIEHVSSVGDTVARRSIDRGLTWGSPYVVDSSQVYLDCDHDFPSCAYVNVPA